MNRMRFLALALVSLMAIPPFAVQAIGDDNNPPAGQPEQAAPQRGAAGAIERLREETDRLGGAINQKRQRVAALASRVEALDPKIAALEVAVAEEEAKATTLEAKLAAAKERSTTLEAKLAAANTKNETLSAALDKVTEANAAVEAAIDEVTELQERALEELEATKGSYEELLGTDESEGTAPEDEKTDNPPAEPQGEDGK